MSSQLADKVQMQHRLFAELSSMFGKEVPLYDKALLVNRVCNEAVCAVLGQVFPGFAISAEQLEKTSGERHGAIRIGRPDEYRWVARFFAAFGMEPHNFYDMTNVGSKSQPIIATAYRSPEGPEHRVFTSLLMTNYFDPATRERIESLLASRRVFSDRAKELIEKGERQGGLDWVDANALIAEGTGRIFKWTGKARDHGLYKDLCASGFKIAADIACFECHHLNHLTPNTLCMDLYTAAMKHALGEMSAEVFVERATLAIGRVASRTDADWMRLHFKHLTPDQIAGFGRKVVSPESAQAAARMLAGRLAEPDLQLSTLAHSGFKDFTEGPSEDTPVLLRQDAYKALTEPVEFTNADGSVVKTVHTARFGEIEQRFYATTPAGRALYDSCLTVADAAREKDPTLPKRDFAAYEALYGAPFAAIPKTLPELLAKGLIYGLYSATAKGIAAAGTIRATDRAELVRLGYARVEGLRYEDFLPVSAAGIFASNLSQYGTKSSAAEKPKYTQAMLEEIIGKPIVDTDTAYRGMEAASLLRMYEQLGLLGTLGAAERGELERAAVAAPRSVTGGPVRAATAAGAGV